MSGWQIPGIWSEIYETAFVPTMIGEWVPRVVALADPQPGEHVLDLACGTGALTRLIADRVGPQGRVIGLDLSPEMLAVARKTAADHSGWARIEWREGDVMRLPFEDDQFDVVFCQLGLMFFPDQVAALREMKRVLRRAGRLGVMVWGAIEKCPGQLAMQATWTQFFGSDAAAGFARQHSLGKPETLQAPLQAAGFTDVFASAAMGTMRFASPERLVRSYGAMMGLDIDEQTRAQVIQAVDRALQRYVGPAGLEYPIEAILAQARK